MRLRYWVDAQSRAFTRGKLLRERELLLDMVGFFLNDILASNLRVQVQGHIQRTNEEAKVSREQETRQGMLEGQTQRTNEEANWRTGH